MRQGIWAELEERALLDPMDLALGRGLLRVAEDPGAAHADDRSLAEEDRSLVAAAIALAHRATARGHVCLDLEGEAAASFPEEDPAQLEGLVFPAAEAWGAALRRSGLCGEEEDPATSTAPLVLERGRWLYLGRLWRAEARLAAALAARLEGAEETEEPEVGAALERFFPGEDAGVLGQKSAVRRLLRHPFGILTGGPGTGKTTTVAAYLLCVLERVRARKAAAGWPRIALAAPTGKAAARLGESMRRGLDRLGADPALAEHLPTEGTTLHRLLMSRRDGSFRHGPYRPIPADLIVVDEVSMADLQLLDRFFAALLPGAGVLLVGDHDQLASVESGAVLRDLCQLADEGVGRLAAVTARLEHSWRYAEGSELDHLARAVRGGEVDEALRILEEARGGAGGEVLWIDEDRPPAESEILRPKLRAGLRAMLQGDGPAARLEGLERFRVLTARASGPWGAGALNQACRRLLGPTEAVGERFPGRPVLVLRNDHGQRLANGDVGVLWPEEDGALWAWFEGEAGTGAARAVVPGRLPAHEDAYALTIHKSQGSEFDEVCVILPPTASPLLVRELLYTGVTRARHRLVLHGPREVIRAALETGTRRRSGLRERLGG